MSGKVSVGVPEVHVVELASELALEGRVKLEKNLAGAHILDTAFVDRPSRKLNSGRHKMDFYNFLTIQKHCTFCQCCGSALVLMRIQFRIEGLDDQKLKKIYS